MPRQSSLLGSNQSLEDVLAEVAADIIQPRPEQTDSSTGLAERSLYEFLRQAWPTIEPSREFTPGWHLGCITEHLQAMESLEIRNLIVNIPPRHCKSTIACVCLFAWAWIRNPSSQWIYCCYGEKLAERDSNRCRDLVQSQWYQARWGHVFRLKRSQNTAERFANDRRGYRIATTVSGKAMGEGGDWLSFDDPNKPTDMRSEAHRAQVIESWTKTMSTRGNDPKTVRKLVIQQRLGERDLTGYLVAERGGYEHLVLPAEYEPRRYFFPQAQSNGQSSTNGHGPVDSKPRDAIVPTILQRTKPHLLDGPSGSGRREEGDLLWPERFGPAEIEALKADLEGVGWAGQGQQRPAPATGSIFRGEMFRRFTLEPGPLGLMAVLGVSGDQDNESTTEPLRLSVQDMRFYQCADTAMTAKAQSAYTVIATFAWHRPTRNLLIWHIFRQRLRVHEQLPAIRELRHGQGLWDAAGRRWLIPGKLAPWPRQLAFQAVEDRASGHGILDEARASGYPLRALKTGSQDKVMRAAVAATMYGAGKVWHRAEVSFLPDLEDELLSFPQGAYSDQCLAPGTLITTRAGAAPIELVAAGAEVWTRSGWRRVLASGQTSSCAQLWRVSLSDGTSVVATAKHPFWVHGTGWRSLDCLAYGDRLSPCEKHSSEAKRLSWTGWCSDVTRTVLGGIFGFTSGDVGRGVTAPCTQSSGRRPMDWRRLIPRFITRMATLSTTTWPIWNVYRLANTAEHTARIFQQVLGCMPILSAFDRSPQPGIVQKLAVPGIGSMAGTAPCLRLSANMSVGVVEQPSNPGQKPAYSTVRQLALPPLGEPAVWMTRTASAWLVAERIASIATPNSDSVPFVVAVEEVDRGPVYNLIIEGEPEFYANGILVHNCDVISYACRLADEDSLLNAAIEGPLLMPSPLNEDGLPATPDDLRRPQGQEVFHVGGTRVVFQDEDTTDGWQR